MSTYVNKDIEIDDDELQEIIENADRHGLAVCLANCFPDSDELALLIKITMASGGFTEKAKIEVAHLILQGD